ncbi:4'-phosphopantetheinyl transferase [Candidatus Burkholderia verschuerenii]|uniref:4'-phosphopantetheinyl transferase n=1 Tax=Candidatus Burkholderia verschuerenii TaxID=242163 RepID=A0A0L0M7D2_9BURK|nr:hypothetical protein [Candidatus Burkholderia verschuerenii]KND58288.1 4'-phosphopantetheinyl transferase [Candidatus Burkholderia verschuerenii]
MLSGIDSLLGANVRSVSLPADTPADVSVWRVEIDLAAPLEIAGAGVLHESELARARRFMLHADAARFATVRATLRLLLAAHLHADATRLVIEADAAGRPMLVSSEAAPDFNVSHSGAYGMIAMSARRRVGVDIEEGRASCVIGGSGRVRGHGARRATGLCMRARVVALMQRSVTSLACKIEFAGMDPTTQSGADVNAHLSQVCSARVEVEA